MGELNHYTYNMSIPPKKHKRTLSSSSNEDSNIRSNAWSQFISIRTDDHHSISTNPFLVAKTIESIAGSVKAVKRLRDGSLLVECSTKQQSTNLLGISQFAGTPVSSIPHKTLNTSKGVIRDRERCLQSLTEDEIASELSSQGVTDVKRFTARKNNETIKLNTYLLTFSSSSLPSKIKAGYNVLGVELYIPKPLRCYKCQQYGHGTRNCNNHMICHRCGEDGHESFDCESPPKCANCGGNHMASSKDCPRWLRESKIIRLKLEKKISYIEARKLVASEVPASGHRSYASVTKSKVQTTSTSCQTDITWVTSKDPITQISNKTNTSAQTATTGKQLSPANHSQPSSSSHPSTQSSSSSSSSQSSSAPAKLKTKVTNSGRPPHKGEGNPPVSPKGKPKHAPRASRELEAASGRLHKGEDDPIQTYNRYGSLENGMDVDPVPPPSKSKSSSPRRGRTHSANKHPPKQ